MDRASDDEPLFRLRLPDGRRVGGTTFGDPEGFPVLALHGTPGSRLMFRMADEAARATGVRLYSLDRWGYGHSDAHPAPSLSAYADDARSIADALGLDRMALLGVSGGGPFAVAVAAGLGDRIAAVALVSPLGPVAAEPDLALSRFQALAFGTLARRPWAVRLVFRGFRSVLERNGPLALRIASARAAAVDRRVVCRPYERGSMVDAFRAGLAPGVEGPVIDMALFSQPWDVDPGCLTAPSRLWIGDADRHVPVSAARGLARRIPSCDLVAIADAGHYWVMSHMPDVLGWIGTAARAGGAGSSGGGGPETT